MYHYASISSVGAECQNVHFKRNDVNLLIQFCLQAGILACVPVQVSVLASCRYSLAPQKQALTACTAAVSMVDIGSQSKHPVPEPAVLGGPGLCLIAPTW